MKAPKILPWIARKSGISDELAINLWRRAAGEAEQLCGDCSSSDYYRLAVERFIDLADEEGEKGAALDPLSPDRLFAGLKRLRHDQERLWQINLIAAQNACRLWHKWIATLGRGEPSPAAFAQWRVTRGSAQANDAPSFSASALASTDDGRRPTRIE